MILKAYAKINLTLDIVGKRKDGYHLIDSVFQSVGLFDKITVDKRDKISVLCGDIGGENNIAFVAAKEYFSFTGISGGAEIKIEKGIPLLSGLGGGSADAAAVIVALDNLYGTFLPTQKLIEIAIKCGADVPYFLFGGTARVGGIGEKVKKLNEIKGFYAVLIKSGNKKSTRDMYESIDNAYSISAVTEDTVRLIDEGKYKSALENVNNAFLSVCKNEQVYSALQLQNPIGVSLSGSGPTYFAIFDNEHNASNAVESLINEGLSAISVPFVSVATEIIE